MKRLQKPAKSRGRTIVTEAVLLLLGEEGASGGVEEGGGGGRRGDWVGGGIGGRGVPRLTVRPSDAERKVDGG